MRIKHSIAGLLLLGWGIFACDSGAAPRESQVKAVYLNGYAKFITWPDYIFSTPDSPFRICVFGENPFGNALDMVVKDEVIDKRPVQAEYISSQEQIPSCQILYISDSERIRVDNLVATASAHPVLTISDLDDFVQHGGMIQFYTRENKVRFFIDPATVRQAGLEPNANLLRISDVVGH